MSSDIEIHANHLRAFGINYFRGGAPSIDLGQVGESKKPVFDTNYYTPEDQVPIGKLKVHKAFTLDVAVGTLKESDLGATISVPKVGKLSAGEASKQLQNRTLRLVQFELLPKDLVDAANQTPSVLDSLRRIGGDGRLVHKVIVAMNQHDATVVSSGGGWSLSAGTSGVAVSVGGSSGSTTKTTYDLSNCTIAYVGLKPKWDALFIKNGKHIDDWEDDNWGPT